MKENSILRNLKESESDINTLRNEFISRIREVEASASEDNQDILAIALEALEYENASTMKEVYENTIATWDNISSDEN